MFLPPSRVIWAFKMQARRHALAASNQEPGQPDCSCFTLSQSACSHFSREVYKVEDDLEKVVGSTDSKD
jgi:hypothetical protein